MLFQEKEKQIFDFSVASEFTQIRCKALSVKTQLLWQRLCALRGFCSCFPPCGVDRLPICRWRRALRLNLSNLRFGFAALLDPFLDILHGRQLFFQLLRQLACNLISTHADGLAHILQRIFRDQIIFALAEHLVEPKKISTRKTQKFQRLPGFFAPIF